MKNYLNKTIFLILSFLFFHALLFGQADELKISGQYKNLKWEDFVNRLEEDHKLRVFYPPDSLTELRVNIVLTEETAQRALSDFLSKHGYQVAYDSENLFITKDTELQTQLPETFFQTRYFGFADSESGDDDKYSANGEKYISRIRTVGDSDKDDKKYATFSGYITNSYDGTPVVGAVMQIEETGQSEVTNSAGFYSFTLKKGTYTLNINSVEVESVSIIIHLLSDGPLNIELNRRYVALDEVLVSSETFHNVKSTNLGFEKLSAFKTAEIPSSIGENDIVKAGLLLPGIQAVGEGASGFNVRGSPVDQNMFYLDRLPVYNTSHFLGFFSSFNAAAIDEFTIYKSSIPAEYSGSLASVIEIKAKDGNKRHFSAAGGISPVSANIQAEGPIVKDRISYMLSLRSSYSNWIFNMINNPVLNKSSASFQDFIGKFTFDVGQNDKIKLLSYYSADYSNLGGDNIYDYQTIGGGIEWNKIIAGKHNLNTNLVYMNYSYTETNMQARLYAYKLPYSLEHAELSSKLNIRINENHKLTFGLNSILYLSDHGSAQPADMQSLLVRKDFIKEQAMLSGVFINEQWKVFDNFTINGSFRLNNYNYLGPATVFEYRSESPYIPENVIDTVSYSDFEAVQSYLHPDFRISANYRAFDNFSVKAGYNNMYQYIFMMSNTIAASPVNKWKLADSNLKPIQGKQYSAGLYFNSTNSAYEISAEAYYKDISNFKDYKDGANIVFSEVPEFDILEGDLDSYGLELMLKKTYGRLNGWVNYSYSRAIVQTQSPFPEQQANRGNPYPASYDKPHAFNFVGSYKFGRRFSVSTNIVYSTGRPITYPVGVYYLDNTQLLNYSGRNEFRIPDYFRLDLSVKLEGNLKADKKAHGTWVLSAYNLTGRDNIYSVFFRSEEGKIRSYKMSVFAEPIITISYQFKLGNYADKYY
jgi:hypothetical protein